MESGGHNQIILDQFTRQADPFVQRHAQNGQAVLEAMLACSQAGPRDSALDVACGPGIVSCFFAAHLRTVTGLDCVPAMLERARKLQTERQLANVAWQLGQSTELPFAAASFDCVVTRFSFHHYLQPETALGEMMRVCRAGGAVLVADVTPSRVTQAAFNGWEVLRDPSHTRALTSEEIEELGRSAGLEPLPGAALGLGMELEPLLEGSFPEPGNADRIRSLFESEIRAGTDRLGVRAHRENDRIQLVYPVSILAWRKPCR